MADLCLLPEVLFILGSKQPLSHVECLLGLDFNQMGPWWSCPQGPHSGTAPLRVMDEVVDSISCWGAGGLPAVGGGERGFMPIPGSCC